MTPDRDIERLLDTWFADGPDGPPDRVVEGVADRIARQPQRPAWRLPGRPSPVPTTALRVALAAALVLAVTGVAFVATRPQAGGPAVSAPPAAAPSMAPTVSPTPGPTPTFDCAAETVGCAGLLVPGEHESANLVVPIRFTVPTGVDQRARPAAHLRHEHARRQRRGPPGARPQRHRRSGRLRTRFPWRAPAPASRTTSTTCSPIRG